MTHKISAEISSYARPTSILYVLTVDGDFKITWYPDWVVLWKDLYGVSQSSAPL